ncbi:uncharacterized protein LOC127561517 [Antechinus flavipes]|uniref:uncharacterized protein LOC127561517 n=1 Tax=Antechinus flavipes TaxID=38775 RepID=UPI002235EE7C|nr:uncharacterized protein LOC127561517 [Antechinus flavipes]
MENSQDGGPRRTNQSEEVAGSLLSVRSPTVENTSRVRRLLWHERESLVPGEVQSTQFMEFSEVENQDDFYTLGAGYIHVQDQQGAYVMYDCALRDLEELESQLLLIVSHYIEKEKSHKRGNESRSSSLPEWAHASVDRFAVLFDVWTWEATFLENKRQLLDSYFEAYQHVFDQEERTALAQVITDIMHHRPRFDFSHPYFENAYRAECINLRLHLQLVRDIVNRHVSRTCLVNNNQRGRGEVSLVNGLFYSWIILDIFSPEDPRTLYTYSQCLFAKLNFVHHGLMNRKLILQSRRSGS